MRHGRITTTGALRIHRGCRLDFAVSGRYKTYVRSSPSLDLRKRAVKLYPLFIKKEFRKLGYELDIHILHFSCAIPLMSNNNAVPTLHMHYLYP